ncbi:G-protein alpha subunit-domain-containing protein [Flagelloscypha sp. PMI_526]|nr:G-protein alpha subunit-domain-containing protein [Flagelloscypha sp. PMI_526]
MLSRQNLNHDSDSTYSASDTSTINYDSQQGIGRVLFSAMRLAGNTVERRLLPNERQPTGSTSALTLVSTSEWEDASETSTISCDDDQGVGRIAWHFMRYAGEKVEFFARRNELLLQRKGLERAARAKSVGIDRQLNRERKSSKKEYKILILGGSGAGKSAVVKQMRLQYGQTYTSIERTNFESTICSNCIGALKAVITILRTGDLQLSPASNEHANTIMRFGASEDIQLLSSTEVPSNVSIAISFIRKDAAIGGAVSRLRDSDFEDPALYFFHAADRIFGPGYLPTYEDILHCHEKTNNITETTVSYDKGIFKLYDAPSDFSIHSLRTKWISHLNAMSALIFVVVLSDYDQENRMDDALRLIELISNCQWFTEIIGIILFFNKMDLFQDKLPRSPLQVYYPSYTGGNDVTMAFNYLKRRFSTYIVVKKHAVWMHQTTLTETSNNCARMVQNSVKDMMRRKNLEDTNLI